jgi:hypothetical protein
VCSPRFYLPASPEERESLRRIFESEFPTWKDRAVAEARILCKHRVDLLGHEGIWLGEEINWNRDPVSGAVWPQRFWADYDLTGDGLPSDPKNIHELGRCQHLPRLGKAYFLTGEERYAEEALAQMSSWIDQNPRGMGIHWNSSLEISLRAISWIWAIFFVLDARSLDEQVLRRVLNSLSAQLQHVNRFLSEYSSPNTHLLGEATALYIGGVLFSEWQPASEWRNAAERILTNQIQQQFTEEGFHGELSSYYHCYALDFYLQAAILSIRNDGQWKAAYSRRIEQMVEVVMHLAHADGSIPSLGDEDGGRALALASTHYKSYRDSLSTAAVLFARPDFKHTSSGFCEETLWFLGAESWRSFAAMESQAPLELQKVCAS